MLQIDIDEAKIRLTELVHKAAEGESFVITDTGKPIAKMVGCVGVSERSKLFGCMRGQDRVTKDFNFKAYCREEIAEMFGLGSQDL